MKKTLLTAFVAALALKASAQTSYTQVALTGYNADVIANGSGAATSSTTHDVDGIMVLAAQNFVSPTNQTPAANTALPNTGLITSAVTTTPGLTFQLAPYTGNNVMRVAANTSGTVNFATPLSTTDLYVLLTPILYSGSSPVTFTVNFTDNTSQVFSGITLTANWYGGTGAAWSGTTRVNRSTNALDVQAIGPRMFQQKLTLSAANATKSIQSIMVANGSAASTNNMIVVMAVSALTPASTLATDAGVTAISAPNSGCALTNAETITVVVKNYGTTAQSNIPVSYKINGGSAVNEVLAGPVAANTSVNYSFTTKANLSALGTYSIEARTNIPGDLLPANDALTKSVILSAAPAVPTISAGSTTTFCTGGSVTLTAASASTGATYQWFNNGTAIGGATNATYAANAAGSYTVVANLNGCNSAASAATTVTANTPPPAPGINISGSATVCAGDSVTLTAASTVTGATFTWFKGGNLIPGVTSASYVVKTAGSYTATATASGCTSPASVARVITVSQLPATPTVTKAGFVLTSSATTGNQWYKNGSAISGQITRIYTVTSNGTYTVKVTNGTCNSLASNAIVVTNVGINEDRNNLAVNIYPNPSAGLFSLELPQGKTFGITVSDLTGKVVKQLSANEQNLQLNLSDSAKGIYILKIVGEGKIATRKLVVE